MKKIALVLVFSLLLISGCSKNYSINDEINIEDEKVILKVNSYEVVNINDVIVNGNRLRLNVTITNNSENDIYYFDIGTFYVKPSKNAKYEDSYLTTTTISDTMKVIKSGETETGNIYFDVDHFDKGMTLEIIANKYYSTHDDNYKYYITLDK